MGVAKAALETSIKYLAKDLGEDGITISGPTKTAGKSVFTVTLTNFTTEELGKIEDDFKNIALRKNL